MVPQAVFLPIGVIGMTGPKATADLVIVPGSGILVLDQQRDGRTRGLAFKHAGENLHVVRLAPLGGMPAAASGSTQQLILDFLCRYRQARWAAVDDTTNGRAMALPKGGNTKQFSK